jgi:hypothetical protein
MTENPRATRGHGVLFPAAAIGVLLVLAAVVALQPFGRGRAPDAPTGSRTECLSCHEGPADLKGGGDPGLVAQWRASVHFRAGVGCADCHGTDHQQMIREKGEVSAGVCGTCHAEEVRQFANRGHSLAEVMAETNAKFLAQSPEMRRQGCLGCHAIGRRFEDGSVGKCNFCHLGHAFSAEQAREPEACATCHIGQDHPQIESYEDSKHGIAYRASRDTRQAPTCATCHMPGGNHDVTIGIALGGVLFGSALEGEQYRLPIRPISRREFERKRTEMLQVCSSCHATSFAREALADADAIKRQSDELVDRAARIVESVYQAGALDPRPEDRPPNPVEGAALVLGTHQLYEHTSPLEQKFFEMAAFFGPTTWKGAYHHSPDHTHWLGNMKLKEAMIYLQAEARRLNGAPRSPQTRPAQTRPSRVATEAAPRPFSTTFLPPSATGVPFKPGARYLGARFCAGCHQDVFASWRKTEMASTFNALYPGADREAKVRSLGIDPDADFTRDPACFPCHTTGFGQEGGFVSLEKTPKLIGVQCESCHGPASEYMDHMVARREGEKVSKDGLVRADVRACVQCHHPSDPCPDPDYVFDYAAMRSRGLHDLHR